MKKIKYTLKSTRSAPALNGDKITENYMSVEKTLIYSDANLAIAEAEAWPDTLEIVEDGQMEPEALPSTEDTLLELTADHEYRICMLELNGGES